MRKNKKEKEFLCDSLTLHVHPLKKDLKIRHKKAKTTPAFMLRLIKIALENIIFSEKPDTQLLTKTHEGALTNKHSS